MINTTIFKSAFIFLVFSSSAMSQPIETGADVIPQSSKPSTEGTPAITGDHYDQRQNGTKNIRVHIDGVAFVIAPLEALLLATDIDSSLLNFGPEGPGESSKPGAASTESRSPASNEEGQKPIKQKSVHSHGLRLSSLLGPILRRISP